MSDNPETSIIVAEPRPGLSLGSLPIDEPEQIIERASRVASALASIIKDRKLYSQISGRNYVQVEGWTTLGAMLGVIPREVSCVQHDDGSFEAIVELVRVTDQAVIGRGSALLGMDEKTWANRPDYARRSMSITRATGKAFRLAFSWIMTLAGYEVTPAEEMDGVQPEYTAPRANPNGQDISDLLDQDMSSLEGKDIYRVREYSVAHSDTGHEKHWQNRYAAHFERTPMNKLAGLTVAEFLEQMSTPSSQTEEAPF